MAPSGPNLINQSQLNKLAAVFNQLRPGVDLRRTPGAWPGAHGGASLPASSSPAVFVILHTSTSRNMYVQGVCTPNPRLHTPNPTSLQVVGMASSGAGGGARRGGGEQTRGRPSSSLLLSSLELSLTQVYAPYRRALPGTASHFCEVVVLQLRTSI